MTRTTHTPGPWMVGSDRVMRQQLATGGIAIMAYCARYDSDMAMFNIKHNELFGKDETTLANARLIAAAPDLLEALKAIAEACEANADSAMGAGWVKAHEKFGAFARAAIAKAEGRA